MDSLASSIGDTDTLIAERIDAQPDRRPPR